MAAAQVLPTSDDLQSHAELLVTDYLKSWRCTRALGAFTNKLSGNTPSAALHDRYQVQVSSRDKAADPYASLLEFLARSARQQPQSGTSGSSSSRRRSSSTNEADDLSDWSKDEVSALKKAIKQTASVEDKNDRWKQIAGLLGTGKSKKQCYLKYKQLKEEQKAAAASGKKSSSSSGSSGRQRSTDPVGRRDSIELTKSSARVTLAPGSSPNPAPKLDTAKDATRTAAKLGADTTGFVPVTRSLSDESRSSSAAPRSDTLEMEDCEDLDDFVARPTVPVSKPSSVSTRSSSGLTLSQGQIPTADQIAAVRQLLFGARADAKTFSSHWDEQGFCFSDTRNLQYGLVQYEGGPCGVLAVVQAYVLRFLLQHRPSDWRNPDVDSQHRALVQALVHILWQAARMSGKTQCTLALQDRPSDSTSRSGVKRRFMAGVSLHKATTEAETRDLIRANLAQFTSPRGCGVVLFVLSVVLTKGVDAISSEMDHVPGNDNGGQLIGGHDYCTQDMVNLLLGGRACSNVFDGDRLLDETASSEDAVTLHGVASRSVVGFLSLFEAYDYIVVGAYLKRPVFNIWVVCSESHYSVLFADPALVEQDAAALDAKPKLDLFYYDELANQDEEIRLTVETEALPAGPRVKPRHDELVPPINLVVQTKWPRASVDWNGVEPLL